MFDLHPQAQLCNPLIRRDTAGVAALVIQLTAISCMQAHALRSYHIAWDHQQAGVLQIHICSSC